MFNIHSFIHSFIHLFIHYKTLCTHSARCTQYIQVDSQRLKLPKTRIAVKYSQTSLPTPKITTIVHSVERCLKVSTELKQQSVLMELYTTPTHTSASRVCHTQLHRHRHHRDYQIFR